MKQFSDTQALRCAREQLSGTLALVPTMGSLHEGHLSLIRHAQSVADHVCVSIYVNPLQFGPNEDFDRYPRDIQADIQALESLNVQWLWTPKYQDLYPSEHPVKITVPHLDHQYCGASRPGFFTGVATVVYRLFQNLRPDLAVFGEKDYQQLLVIRHMVKDLDLGVDIQSHEIVREASGLAMSSRNQYLSDAEREAAASIYKGLSAAMRQFETGERDAKVLLATARAALHAHLDVEYLDIVDADLNPVSTVESGNRCLIAVHLGSTRLIDNICFS
mgnify:CR=1 FL=1